MDQCHVEGCSKNVSKAGHELCLDHWKAQRSGQVRQCDRCGKLHDSGKPLCRACSTAAPATTSPHEDDAPAGFLSSRKIGQHFGLSPVKINLILAELGWIERYVKGWVYTPRGESLGANQKEMRNGTPFVVWPTKILQYAPFRSAIGEQIGAALPDHVGSALADHAPPRSAKADPTPKPDDFRSKFPKDYCAMDGHMVRSRAEVIIDNFLYVQGIVHAYERRLPIEEDCYCDFYIPKGKGGVYIEYWGLENDAKYRERKTAKQAIYAKYKMQLIELGDAEIERLDDVLPRMLLRFGIESA